MSGAPKEEAPAAPPEPAPAPAPEPEKPSIVICPPVVGRKTHKSREEMAADAMDIQAEAQKALEMLRAQEIAKFEATGEVDPLDEFMKTSGIMADAQKEVVAAVEKAAADEATIAAGGEIDEGDRKLTYEQARAEEESKSWHCYICKKWGHTKRDCPDRKWDPTRVSARQAEDMGLEMCCKHCGESGHIIRDCPKKKADDKAASRRKQYEKKKMIRAAERLAIKNKAERDAKLESETKKREFEAQVASYGSCAPTTQADGAAIAMPAPLPAMSAAEKAAIEKEMAKKDDNNQEAPEVD